jgi:hypothetical protein
MIDIQRTLFLVDGQTEILALQSKFNKEFRISPKFRKVDCNGKKVEPEGYANKVAPMIILASSDRFSTFFCILDREKRVLTAEELASRILTCLQQQLNSILRTLPSIIICVPDMMFENWIIADVEGIKKCVTLVKADAQQKNFEGKSGCRYLNGFLKVPYKKTLHAETLFKSIRFNNAKLNSKSFAKFINSIEKEQRTS